MGQMKVAWSGSGFIIMCLVKCCRFRVIIQTHPHLMLLFPPICYIHMYIIMCVYIYIRMYIYLYIYAPVLILSNKMLRNMIGSQNEKSIDKYIHIHTYIYIYIHMQCLRFFLKKYLYTYIYIYVCMWYTYLIPCK